MFDRINARRATLFKLFHFTFLSRQSLLYDHGIRVTQFVTQLVIIKTFRISGVFVGDMI